MGEVHVLPQDTRKGLMEQERDGIVVMSGCGLRQGERAKRVVIVDRETIGAKIRDVLANEEGLIAVYLFGSQAEGKAHHLSDIDIAVLFDDQMSSEQLFERTLAIGSLLEQALPCTVDVIPLNRAGPLLRFQVIQKGQLLLEWDRTRRCLFHMRAMNTYYDVKPYLDYQRSEAIRRIREEGLGHGYQGHRNALTEARRLRAALARSPARASGRVPGR